jgi:hypothetical protein
MVLLSKDNKSRYINLLLLISILFEDYLEQMFTVVFDTNFFISVLLKDLSVLLVLIPIVGDSLARKVILVLAMSIFINLLYNDMYLYYKDVYEIFKPWYKDLNRCLLELLVLISITNSWLKPHLDRVVNKIPTVIGAYIKRLLSKLWDDIHKGRSLIGGAYGYNTNWIVDRRAFFC